MAWDFTLSTGNRISRGRRSTSNVQQPTQNASVTRQVAREAPTQISDPGNDPFIGLAAGLGQFFGKMSLKEDQARLAEEEQRNNEAIVEAQRRVWANPEGAKEAIRTGDYSAFIEDDELRSRKAVQDGFMSAAAASAAQMDFKAHGKAFINSLTAVDDPVMAWQEYIASKTEGANSIYTSQFYQTSMALAKPEITKFQNARYNHMVTQAKEQANNVLREAFRQQAENPTGTFDPYGVGIKAFAGLPIPAPLKDQFMREQLGSAAREEAARSNQAAYDFYMNDKVNPADKSSPTWDQYYNGKGMPLYKAMHAENVRRREQVSAQTNQDIEKITDDFLAGKASAGQVLGAIAYWEDDEGVSEQNSRIINLKKLVAKQMEDTYAVRTLIPILSGQAPINSIPDDQRKDVIKYLDSINYDPTQLAQQFGFPVGQAHKIVQDLMVGGYISESRKRKNAAFIFDNGLDINTRTEQLRYLISFTNENLRAILPAGKADQVSAFVELYKASPDLASQALRRISDAYSQDVDITSYSSLDASVTNTKFLKKVRSSISGYDNMSEGTKKRIISTANVLAVGLGLSEGMSFLGDLYDRENMAAIRGADGTITYEIPEALGNSSWANKEDLEGLNDLYKMSVEDGSYVNGTSGSMGGYSLSFDNGNPMMFIPDVSFRKGYWVDKDIPKWAEGFSKSTTSKGRIRLDVPPAPKEGESHVRDIGNALFMVWERGAWNVRFSPDRDLTKTSDVPPGADLATSLIHRRLEEREKIDTKLSGFKEQGDIGTTADGVLGLSGTKSKTPGRLNRSEVYKLIGRKADLDAEIRRLTKFSGANETVAKMLRDYMVDAGGSPELRELAERLETDPKPITKTAQPSELIKAAQKAITSSRKQSRVTDHGSISKQENSFELLVLPHLNSVEGYTPVAKPDADTVSIGFGWNLNQEHIQSILKSHGYSISDLKSGKERISKEEGLKILPDVWRWYREDAVKRVGEDVWASLSDKQRVAITSLNYNTPELLGKGLLFGLQMFKEGKEEEDKAKIKAGLEIMNFEVRHNSLPHEKMIKAGNMNLIDGLTMRRNLEADMLLDGFLKGDDGNPIYAPWFPPWRELFADIIKKRKKRK